MFQASSDRLRGWLTRIDESLEDVLGDPVGREPAHPHRIPLRWSYDRRGGSVPARPGHCISPVHHGDGMRRRDPATR